MTALIDGPLVAGLIVMMMIQDTRPSSDASIRTEIPGKLMWFTIIHRALVVSAVMLTRFEKPMAKPNLFNGLDERHPDCMKPYFVHMII